MTVLLAACGGTIASRSGPGGVSVGLRGEELLAAAGIDGADIVDLARGPSWSLDPAAVEGIARAVVAAASSRRYDGVVVTHGTDTVEETMLLTWLLGGAAASERCPIVFTAAMHHADHPEPDGPRNLAEAVDLARAGGTAGPVLRIAGATHHARWVTKADTSALDAFRSPGARAAGSPPPHGETVEPRVAQVHAHTGIDGDVVGWHLDGGARGLVVEGTGAGNVHASLVAGIERALDAGVPVVVTSRCWTGAVSPTYGGRGGGASLAALGCIAGGDLPTHKARVALAVALGHDPAPASVASWFAKLVG